MTSIVKVVVAAGAAYLVCNVVAWALVVWVIQEVVHG